jgi:hypothetical protein
MIAATLTLLFLTTSPELAEGRVASSELKFARAVESLKKVVADDRASTPEKLEAWELLARAQLALNQADAARAAWTGLLALNPLAPEPSGAPRVKQSFLAAKQAKFPAKFLQVTRAASADDVLELDLLNPWSLSVTVELWEAVGQGDFAPRVLAGGAHLVTALKAGSRNYVRVVASDGVLLASLGSPAEWLAGPAAPVTDAPKRDEPKKDEPVTLTPTQPEPAPSPVRHAGLSASRVVALVISGVALVAVIIGAVLLGNSAQNQNIVNGWPLNGIDYDVYTAAQVAAPQQLLFGGVTGGAGLAVAITGAVLFFALP